MANQDLREAMLNARVSVEDVSRAVEVDPKTVQRWLGGRLPHPRHRWAVARLVGSDPRELWPTTDSISSSGAATSEVVAAYPHRADVPADRWWAQLTRASSHIDLLGYAFLFIPEAHPRLVDLLRGKAASGCQVRLLFGDPECDHVHERDKEEGLAGAMAARIRTSLLYFEGLRDCDGVEARFHTSPLYNSVFRFDEEMFVTPHLYGTPGYSAPLLHLRRAGAGGVFDGFARHFAAVWETAGPVRWPG